MCLVQRLSNDVIESPEYKLSSLECLFLITSSGVVGSILYSSNSVLYHQCYRAKP